jgi:hypothetical protein
MDGIIEGHHEARPHDWLWPGQSRSHSFGIRRGERWGMGGMSFGCGFGGLRHLWHRLSSLGSGRWGYGEGSRGGGHGLHLALFTWVRGGGLRTCWGGMRVGW